MNISEKRIESIYKKLVNQMSKQYGSGETTNLQLQKLGKKLFGNKFKNVYPSDKIKSLEKGQCCIVNLDDSTKMGSHWTALSRDLNNKLYFYDSFGRSIDKIIPVLKKKFKGEKIHYDTKDKEQDINEDNCGQRCLCWLIIFYDFGGEMALKI